MRNTSIIKNFLTLLPIVCLLACSGCASLDGPPNPDDPLERYNRSMHKFNEVVDRYAFKPVAKGYKKITPGSVDKAVTNIFSNIDDVTVVINDLLQLKIGQAIADTARIVFNTTFGLFGIFDVSTSFGLPKHNEDFGQTLGYWGVGSGPYLVLPFFGPSNPRDGIGLATDLVAFSPVTDELDSEEKIEAIALKYIDLRADLLKATDIIEQTAPDPYTYIRDAWMQRRLNLVYDGNAPDDFNEDDLFEDDLFLDDTKQ